MKILVLICSLFLVLSCRKVESEAKPQIGEVNLLSFMRAQDPYIQDESLDIFLRHPWYTYDQGNHIIWPNFQIYGVRSRGIYYKLQIINYYDGDRPGNYTLRIEEEGKAPELIRFEAQGCGNVFTNPNFNACMNDPEQNVYTYLDFHDFSTRKLSDQVARSDRDWDFAFNGTTIKFNSGDEGPGDVRVAPLYLYERFYNGEAADFQAIAEVSFSDKGKRFFDLTFDLRRAAYKLPSGVDRVFNEPDWFGENIEGQRFANDQNWWIVRGKKGFYKLRVKEIQDLKVGEDWESKIVFEFYSQEKSEETFQPVPQIWELPVISSSTRSLRWCLKFESQAVVECSEGGELRLGVLNRRGRRRWAINVNDGAIGPLSTSEAGEWTSAPR